VAARTIVTSHPDVACDVCGRRLLRGEQPDTFLGAGQRRLVCELCTSRATHEGWSREAEQHTTRARAEAPQRGRSLLGRFRQSRWSTTSPDPVGPTVSSGGADRPIEDRTARPVRADLRSAAAVQVDNRPERAAAFAESPPATAVEAPEDERADSSVRRALEVFNAGEHPRRVAGVTRSLGPPSVRAAPLTGATVAIVVAWELCWYRYEIDLGDEAQGARLTAEGMELGELSAEELLANAAADQRGALALVSESSR
jgi:hypothetical protein